MKLPKITPEERDQNFKNFQEWLRKNQKKIKPKANMGVLYSGVKSCLKMMPSGIVIVKSLRQLEREIKDLKDSKDLGKPIKQMWMFLDMAKTFSKIKDEDMEFQAIEDVLRKINNHPPFYVANKPEKFYNLYDYAYIITKDSSDLFMGNEYKDRIWRSLSRVYAGNCVGDVKIFKGLKNDLNELDETSILMSEEIPRLLRNPDISAKTRSELKKIEKTAKQMRKKYLSTFQKKLGQSEKDLKLIIKGR